MTYNPNASGTPQISRSTSRIALNNSGSSLAKFLPVKIIASGISTVNPSLEGDIDSFAGLTRTLINNGNQGEVVNSGIIEDTGVAFAVGDVIYLSKSGGVTNVKPSIGVGGFVSGDFIVRLGVITQNANPSLRDAIIFIQFLGQL